MSKLPIPPAIEIIIESDACPPIGCKNCPIYAEEFISGESYCDLTGGDSFSVAARLWLFDHGYNKSELKQKLAPPSFSNVSAESFSSEVLEVPSALWDRKLPVGVVHLSQHGYRDQMKVRVFIKNFSNEVLNEIDLDAEFRLEFTGTTWWLFYAGNTSDYGFEDDPDLGCVRAIHKDGEFLSDVLVIGCDENVLHPVAHKRRNFRKIKI